MNILTFDIEEWYLEKVKGGEVEEKCRTFDDILSQILDMLDVKEEKATFFCVGKMGCEFPDVVRKIYKRGHEIGCHSNVHTWLNKMTEEECRQDTREAMDSLEQCVGEKIVSYRAPAFSIGENNKWAFEILAEFGIERDSSVYPSTRDFGGFPNFGSNSPSLISYNGITLKEYPISMTTIMGKRMAYSGGGYFRFFPLWFVRRQMKKSKHLFATGEKKENSDRASGCEKQKPDRQDPVQESAAPYLYLLQKPEHCRTIPCRCRGGRLHLRGREKTCRKRI